MFQPIRIARLSVPLALLALACEGLEPGAPVEEPAPVEETAAQALTAGPSCLVLPGDGVSCPDGHTPRLNGRIFTCEKIVERDPSCPIGYYQHVRDGKDVCKVIACLPFTDCSNHTPTCGSGWSYVNDGGPGNRDACERTEFKYANGCFGNPASARFGVTCLADVEGVEVVSGKFRCVDQVKPACLAGTSLSVQAGADTCVALGLATAPFCGLLPPPAAYELTPDVVGNADRCVVRGWPAPVPVLAP